MIGRAENLALTIFLGALSSASAQTPGAFTATGSMTIPRQFHAATLLTNGKVLITGGYSVAANLTSTAELYDPSTGTFTATGSMTTPRSGHMATLLPSGKVLIIGSGGGTEVYDPETGIFTDTGLGGGAGPRLLNNGEVLIVGSDGVYIYDPSTGNTAFTGMGFSDGTTTVLANGTVLITSSDLAWVYDPATGTVTRTGDMILPGPGAGAVAVSLTNGKVLIAGGTDGDYLSTDVAEIYDPATGTFSVIGKMTAGVAAWLATVALPDGKVLITGETSGCQPVPQDAVGCPGIAELYDPAAGTFSSPGRSQSGEGHAETLLPDGTVLITGGWYFCGFLPAPGCGGTLAKAQIYHPGVLVPAPQLFSISGDSKGQGAIWHSATGEITSSGNPAIAGEALSMYAANLGEGGVIPPQVAVDGRLAQVVYFGDAPGYPGYHQVNFRVPAGVAPGPAASVRLTYLKRPSNAVTIGVQ
jgi:hypothetical protein